MNYAEKFTEYLKDEEKLKNLFETSEDIKSYTIELKPGCRNIFDILDEENIIKSAKTVLVNGDEITMEVDEKDNNIKTYKNAITGYTITNIRNSKGKLIKTEDSDGKIIDYEYDDNGRIFHTKSNYGKDISFVYTSRTLDSKALIIIDNNTKEFVQYSYDKGGRITDILTSTEMIIHNLYDEDGSLIDAKLTYKEKAK